jgi:hypothetical protein
VSNSVRPTVAAIVTSYYPDSHADVIVGKLLTGYVLQGRPVEPRITVASLYLDQEPVDDMGRALATRHGVPVYDSVGEALGLGRPGVNVDGVLIVGEHGDYPINANGQLLYPRRRLFDAAVAAMVAAGRVVPIFVDKHLSWSGADALRMYDTAQRLGIPLLAGSTTPIAWRSPAIDWPLGTPMTEAVTVSYDSPEAYEFHALEALQCLAERRAGGETGVVAVEDIPRTELARARLTGRWSPILETRALQAAGLEGHPLRRARQALAHAFLVEYRDGLRAAVLHYEGGVRNFAVAAESPQGPIDVGFRLEPRRPFGHFALLVRQIERMVLEGAAPYPAARTLLTTCVLDAAMRSRGVGGGRIPTPEIAALTYEAPGALPDTATAEEPPFDPL